MPTVSKKQCFFNWRVAATGKRTMAKFDGDGEKCPFSATEEGRDW